MLNRKTNRLWMSAVLMERVDRLRFFTLTVPEHRLPLRVVADRWRAFQNTRWWRGLKKGRSYIVVYEPHPSGHGWHIHVLTNFYIPWQELQLMARSVHFGHTDIEAVDNQCALYVAKYVTKAEVFRKLQDSRHVRIVNVSRDLLALRDVDVSSPSIDFIRSHWDEFGKHVKSPFFRMRQLYLAWVYTWSGVVLSPHVSKWADDRWVESHCSYVFAKE